MIPAKTQKLPLQIIKELARSTQTQSLSNHKRIFYRWSYGFFGDGAGTNAGFTVPAGLAGAYSAGSAGLTRELAMGMFKAGCTERLAD